MFGTPQRNFRAAFVEKCPLPAPGSLFASSKQGKAADGRFLPLHGPDENTSISEPDLDATASDQAASDGCNKTALMHLALKCAVGVIVVTLALALLSKVNEKETRRYSPRFVRNLRTLVGQAAQWSTVAEQDHNPVLALMHVNTALAQGNVARRLVPHGEVRRLTGVDIDELIYALEQEQQNAMRRINQGCPSLQPEGAFVTHTGWLG